MDIPKSSENLLGTLFAFATAVIPGSAGLLLFSIHHRELVERFWSVGSITYQTKLFVALLFVFSIGWTISAALNGIRFAAFAVFDSPLPSTGEEVASAAHPWFDKNWRALVRLVLKDAAPDDAEPFFGETLQRQLEFAEQFPEPERAERIHALLMSKTTRILNALRWQTLWFHFNVWATKRVDLSEKMSFALGHDFAAASILLLAGVFFTPSLRHWWIITPSLFWVVAISGRTFEDIKKANNPTTTMTKQLELLQQLASNGGDIAKAVAGE